MRLSILISEHDEERFARRLLNFASKKLNTKLKLVKINGFIKRPGLTQKIAEIIDERDDVMIKVFKHGEIALCKTLFSFSKVEFRFKESISPTILESSSFLDLFIQYRKGSLMTFSLVMDGIDVPSTEELIELHGGHFKAWKLASNDEKYHVINHEVFELDLLKRLEGRTKYLNALLKLHEDFETSTLTFPFTIYSCFATNKEGRLITHVTSSDFTIYLYNASLIVFSKEIVKLTCLTSLMNLGGINIKAWKQEIKQLMRKIAPAISELRKLLSNRAPIFNVSLITFNIELEFEDDINNMLEFIKKRFRFRTISKEEEEVTRWPVKRDHSSRASIRLEGEKIYLNLLFEIYDWNFSGLLTLEELAKKLEMGSKTIKELMEKSSSSKIILRFKGKTNNLTFKHLSHYDDIKVRFKSDNTLILFIDATSLISMVKNAEPFIKNHVMIIEAHAFLDLGAEYLLSLELNAQTINKDYVNVVKTLLVVNDNVANLTRVND